MVRQARQLRMEFADKSTIAELIHAWGVYRDQGKWKELRGTFTPDGHISVSWFRGPFEQFVERCRSGFAASRTWSRHQGEQGSKWILGLSRRVGRRRKLYRRRYRLRR